jgi:uncharacterized membrane protein
MPDTKVRPPKLRAPVLSDFRASLALGWTDFIAAPTPSLFFASFFVIAGLVMAGITYGTGQTYWLILAVLGFPLIGTLAATGFYEISQQRLDGHAISFGEVIRRVWAYKNGQSPWLAYIIVVVFLFWFFLGHMIFALFLGLSPMTNVSTSLEVFLSPEGLSMIAVGTVVGAVFATLVFSLSLFGIPMLIERDVDFVTAMLSSISAVMARPGLYLIWGLVVATITIASMAPLFLGLFVSMSVLGHATWHLYKRLSQPSA